jgi:5-methylcytosine-specific restriction endonuclease McrA
VQEKRARQRIHTDRRNRPFRLATLERDGYVCHRCGKHGNTLDYVVPLVLGGRALDETNAVCACKSCNSRRGAEITNGMG